MFQLKQKVFLRLLTLTKALNKSLAENTKEGSDDDKTEGDKNALQNWIYFLEKMFSLRQFFSCF